MNIGHMDRRIALQSTTLTTNDYGQRVASWATYATVWASIKYKGGSEKVTDDQVGSTQTVDFTIRYSTDVSGVKASHRLVYNSQNYEILYVQEIGRKEGLILVCELRSA